MTLPFKQIIADPQLADVLDKWKENILRDFNCHAIATVKEFNIKSVGSSYRAMITAQINYQKTYFEKDSATGQYTPRLFPYPLLVDCPAIILCGGNASLQLPISVGDQCLILFNDRDIDNWNKGAINTGVNTPRMHALSDGLALVGLNVLPDADYDNTRAILRNGEAMVGVGEELIKIANEMTTLKTVINGLIDTLNTVLQTGSNGGGPVVFSGLASLPAYKTTVGSLLE